MTAQPSVIVVDDEPSVVSGLRRVLTRVLPEFAIVTATSGEEALAKLVETPCDVVLTDLRMPHMSGLELLRLVAKRMPSVGRVLLSGTADADATIRALPVAHRFLCKPSDRHSLAATCREVYETVTAPSNVAGVMGLAIDEAALTTASGALKRGGPAVVDAIAAHPSLCGALLHALGSEFLGSRTSVSTLEEGINVVGEAGLAFVLGSGFLHVVRGAPAASVIRLAAQGRARANLVAARGGSAVAVLSALVADVDRFGSCDADTWLGPRDGGGALTLMRLWGISAILREQVESDARVTDHDYALRTQRTSKPEPTGRNA